MAEAPTLAHDTVLVRAAEITVWMTDDDMVAVEAAGERMTVPHEALAILAAFVRPRTIGDVLASLATTGPEQFLELTSIVLQLVRGGLLGSPGDQGRLRTRGYLRPAIHVAMLDDHARTTAFCDAIRASVTASSVVVDIGTGTGVLATCAALAGAKRVYALESTGIADVAERMFETNRVSERVTLLRGRSTHVTLPERANLLVTEMIGDDPLDEHLIEIIADARRRLLAPGARTIPEAIELVAIAVDLPEKTLNRHTFTAENIRRYEARYGMSFEALLAHSLGTAQPIQATTVDVCGWPVVAPVASLIDIDLNAEVEVPLRAKLELTLSSPAARLAVVLAFRARLGHGIELSTVPADVDSTNHWWYPVWPALEHQRLPTGAVIDVEYVYERGASKVAFARKR